LALALGCLVFFYCYYCNSELLEEGTTLKTTIEGDVTIEETTTIENKTTGDVLDSKTGIVGETYEGDFDTDWGGVGSIAGMLDCTQYFNSGKCAVSSGTSLTTFQQNINLEQFSISSGGQIDWALDFYAPIDNVNAYTEAKGYLDGVLQFETGQHSLAYTNNPAYYTGNYNFDGGLDRLFISIGGYNTYYADNASLTIQYNVITTVINQYLNIIEPTIANNEMLAQTAVLETYDYNTNTLTDNSQTKTDTINNFEQLESYEPLASDTAVDTTATIDVFTENYNDTSTTTESMDLSMNTTFDEPIATVDTVMEEFNLELETAQTEIPETSIDGNLVLNEQPETTLESTVDNIDIQEVANESGNDTQEVTVDNKPIETQTIENETNETENTVTETENADVQTLEKEGSTTDNATENNSTTTKAESEEESKEGSQSDEKTLVADNNNNKNEVETSKEENNENIDEGNKEDAKEEPQPEEKKIANNDSEKKEESKKEVEKKEKKPQEKKVAEKEPKKEEIKKTLAQQKEEKKQEQKQKKANTIIANITSQYDGLAQVTMLALVNALGPDYNSYRNQQQITNTVPNWYKTEEIYSDKVLSDPLGDYIKVKSSIMLEKMIDMQYDK